MASEWQETPYGRIAAGFTRFKLSQICQQPNGVQTGPFGSQLHQKDYVASGTPIITVQHLGDNRINHQEVPRVSDADLQRLQRYSLQEGDIVFSRVGSVDRRALVREAEDGWLFSGRCLRVRPDNQKADSGYLSWFFGLPSFQEHIRKIAVGATMPSINTQILSEVSVYLPPLPEQRAIAGILGSLDDKIELNRRLNATLEEMARALFRSWFVDFDPVRAKAAGAALPGLSPDLAALFPAAFDQSTLGPIPHGWRVDTIVNVSDRVAMGPFGSSIKVSTFVSDGIPIISGQHLNGVMLDDSEFNFVTSEHAERLSRSNVQRGDVIFTHAGSIGQAAYIPETSRYERYIISQRQFYMRCNRDVMSPLFVVSYFKTPEGQHRLLANTSSTGVPSISRPVSYLKQLKIMVPPREVLNGFDTNIGSIHLQMAHHNQQSRALAQLRDALLPELLSGRLRVPEPLDDL